MSFLTPLSLLLALLALPIILMYMLRLRRREMRVSSTLLWEKLVRDREANAPWQRLRRNLLLLLQLLILGALVLALARPFLPTPAIVRGNTVVLLDASASMQATDVAPSRFAAAQAEVNQLINGLSGNDQMTLIKAGRTPGVLVAASSDRALLRRALEEARPDAAPADWPAALTLAAGAVQGFQNARLIIVSDGGLPADLPPLPVDAIFIPIGVSGENLAISALATRDTPTGPELFASVYNTGLSDRVTVLSVELDGALFDARRLTVPAGESASATWTLPAETAVISAHLSPSDQDYLALDDRAWAVHTGGLTNRALLITEGNLFLEQLFSVLPGVQAFKTTPGSDLAQEAFDLLVFDGATLPDPPPDADLLIINPPPDADNALFSVTGSFTNTVTVQLADSPLLQYVDWRNVNIREAQAVRAPWAQPLVTAAGGPLLLVGEQGGRRIALLTFDLRASDLPLQIAFPILMANITNWLSPGRAFDAPTGLQPGEPVRITPAAGVTAVSVRKPDGEVWTAPVTGDALFFGETHQLGLYQISLQDALGQDDSGARPAGGFAVNLFAPAESRIRPVDALRIGQMEIATAADADFGRRELWPWLLGLALIILLVEWWVHFRGAQLPTLKRS